MTTAPQSSSQPRADRERPLPLAFVLSAAVGALGGTIGLGGAEFRLPLLIGVFGFVALHAVVLNKALSLIVVVTALPARLLSVPYAELAPHWTVVANLLAGSLVGAWAGATWATRMASVTLHRVLAGLLVAVSVAIVTTHLGGVRPSGLDGAWQVAAGLAAGSAIGVVAALMGVAGGELLIPTIVVLYAVDVRIAGSLSLVVSLPTMLISFARYSRDRSFAVLAAERTFLVVMAAGSVCGAVVGGLALGVVPSTYLVAVLAALLVVSAAAVWRHD